MSAGQSVVVETTGDGLNTAPGSTRLGGVDDLDAPLLDQVHSARPTNAPVTRQMREDFEARKQAARLRMFGESNTTVATNAVIGVAHNHIHMERRKALPTKLGNTTQREVASTVGAIVRCGAASNARECLFTAATSGNYIFNWATRATVEIVSLSQIDVSIGRSMGTVLVPVASTAPSCCSTSVPANPASCTWSDVRNVRYDLGCSAATGYPGQSIRVALSAGDEVLVLSGGKGLM